MEKQKIQQNFLTLFGKKLKKYGFTLKVKEQSFVKSMPLGVEYIHVSFIEHDRDINIVISFSIRFDQVEKIVNQNNNLLTDNEKNRTSTIGIELGNLINKQQKRWIISSEEDIKSTVGQIMVDYIHYISPYLKKYSIYENAFEVLAEDDPEAWLHSAIHYERAKRAVALAMLIKKKDEVLQLINKKKNYLDKRNDPQLRNFLEFTKQINK